MLKGHLVCCLSSVASVYRDRLNIVQLAPNKNPLVNVDKAHNYVRLFVLRFYGPVNPIGHGQFILPHFYLQA